MYIKKFHAIIDARRQNIVIKTKKTATLGLGLWGPRMKT
jgi:hypothetical protein